MNIISMPFVIRLTVMFIYDSFFVNVNRVDLVGADLLMVNPVVMGNPHWITSTMVGVVVALVPGIYGGIIYLFTTY